MGFTHFNENGRAKMVDVGDKIETTRVAVASGYIKVGKIIIKAITENGIKKGDVLNVAQIAGIMGAKKTSDIIPMCHPIFLTGVNLEFNIEEDRIIVEATTKTFSKTGVEMEALTAVSIACLTIYDMCKAISKDMVIGEVKLIKKTGGKSDYEDNKN